MKYVKVGQTSEVKDGEKLKVTLNDKVYLITNIQGTYYAIDNKCTHMGGSLYDGKLEGNRITCPRHGSVFDVRTGKLLQNGKILFVTLNVKDTQAYPVKIDGDDILLGLE